MKTQSLFSTRLKMLRKQKQLTQQELGDVLGVTQTTCAKWENGRTEPTLENVIKLAIFLDTTTDYLLGMDRKKE